MTLHLNTTDKAILRLAGPAVITNITVPLLGLVDLAIVGHMGSGAYIAAVAVGSMLFNVMYWLMGFLRMSTSGLTAQEYGKLSTPVPSPLGETVGALSTLNTQHSTLNTPPSGQPEEALAALCIRSLLLGVLIGVVLFALQWPLRWVGLALMHPDESIVPMVKTYFSICIWGAPAVLGLYALTGWFIGMQDTRSPMVVSIGQNVLNIVASLLLVYGLGMKIEGVALGTMLAQWSGFGVALWLARRKINPSTLNTKLSITPPWGSRRGLSQLSITPPWGSRRGLSQPSTLTLLSLNLNIFLRTVCLVAVNLFFTAFGARQGNLILSVNTLLMTFFMLFSYFLDGFAYAAEALCGKAWGALSKEQIRADETASAQRLKGWRNLLRALFRWGWGLACVFTLAYLLLGTTLLRLLTNEPEVLAAAQSYFWWVLIIPAAGMVAFIYDGVFIGITAAKGMLLATAVAAALFFVLFIALFPLIGNHALWAALIVFLAVRGIAQHFFLKRIER